MRFTRLLQDETANNEYHGNNWKKPSRMVGLKDGGRKVAE